MIDLISIFDFTATHGIEMFAILLMFMALHGSRINGARFRRLMRELGREDARLPLTGEAVVEIMFGDDGAQLMERIL